MKYEFLPHTADIKFRAYGRNLEEAFENAVLAVVEYLTGGEKIKPRKGKVVNVHGSDLQNLFYNFLDEMIYLLDAENFVVGKANVSLLGNNIKAEFFGDDAFHYKLKHVKSATYSEMLVRQENGRWVLQAVLDV